MESAIWSAVIILLIFYIYKKRRYGFVAKTTVNDKLFKKYAKLNKEATALKKQGNIEAAIDKLNEAYAEASEKELTVTINDYLRLPAYLQIAKRNDEAWSWFNKLIQQFSYDFMSLSQIYDKMRLFRQREKKNKDAIKYAVLSNIYRCMGLHQQVTKLGWDDRKEELENCKIGISVGYEKLLKKANCSELEGDLTKLIEAHIKSFPKIKVAQLIKDIEALVA
ncbi:MAG: hypothetical protein DBP02_10095 [gamma proteobacterium symbiont of Ctena orbiculata]|nr:MAG: hypothetical protein DBP02_10095 [gamma proteobacterium symbiont of Ctena orbiculata]